MKLRRVAANGHIGRTAGRTTNYRINPWKRICSPAAPWAISGMMVAMSLATGCAGGDDSQASGGPGSHGAPAGGNRPKQPPIPVAVSTASIGAISSYYTATATLAAENEATILARVTGVVSRLGCEEGDAVRKGDVLLTITNDEYVYRLNQAEARRADLQSRVDRLEAMHSQDLVSVEDYETLKNDLKAADAEAGLARVNLSYTRVTAPFDGYVVTRSVNVGQNVTAGSLLFILSDFDPLLARIYVPSRRFNMLQSDQPVDLILESDETRLKGRIKLISPTIDPASGTIKVTVEIRDYPDGVRPGDFARVSIVTERRENRVLVPKIAVVTDRGEQVVYVAPDSTAERRVVDIGFQDDVHAEILGGISEGERIVVKGQRSLKHGSPLRILEDDRIAETDAARRDDS